MKILKIIFNLFTLLFITFCVEFILIGCSISNTPAIECQKNNESNVSLNKEVLPNYISGNITVDWHKGWYAEVANAVVTEAKDTSGNPVDPDKIHQHDAAHLSELTVEIPLNLGTDISAFRFKNTDGYADGNHIANITIWAIDNIAEPIQVYQGDPGKTLPDEVKVFTFNKSHATKIRIKFTDTVYRATLTILGIYENDPRVYQSTNLSESIDSSYNTKLTWNDNSLSELNYRLVFHNEATTTDDVIELPKNSTSYNLGYIQAGDYNFYIEVYNDMYIAKSATKRFNLNYPQNLVMLKGGSKLDEFRSIQKTSDGGFIVAGRTESNDGDIIGNHGGSSGTLDGLLIKMNSSGNVEWQKLYGTVNGDEICGIVEINGGYVFAGYKLTDTRLNDFWVVKLDSNGNIVGEYTYGGSLNEFAYSIAKTNDGGYIVTGVTQSNDGDVSGYHSNNIGGYKVDIWVIKLSSSMTLEWQKVLGGSKDEQAYSIIQTSDNGYVLTGYTESNDGDVTGFHETNSTLTRDIWVVKLSATGGLLWQKALGGTNYDYSNQVIENNLGQYLVAGMTPSTDGDVTGREGIYGQSDAWVVCLSSDGVKLWDKYLGTSRNDYALGIIQTTDGGYAVTGYVNSTGAPYGSSGADAYVAKVDSTFNKLEWLKTIGGSLEDIGYSIQQLSSTKYIIAGFTYSSDGIFSQNHGARDAFVATTDAVITDN